MPGEEVQQRRESREQLGEVDVQRGSRPTSRASGTGSIGGGSMNLWQAQRESVIKQTIKILPDEMVPNVFNHYSDEAMADPDHDVPGLGVEPALHHRQRKYNMDLEFQAFLEGTCDYFQRQVDSFRQFCEDNAPTPPPTDEELNRVPTPAPVLPVKSHIIYWPLGKYTATEVYNLPVVQEPVELALQLHHMLLNVVIFGHLYNLPFAFASMAYAFIWNSCKLVKRVNSEMIPPFFMSILIWFELRFLLYLRYVDACISVFVERAGKKFPILKWSLAGLVNRISEWVGATWLWKSVLEPLGKMIGFLETPAEEEEEEELVAMPVSRVASPLLQEMVQENEEVAS